MNQKDEGTQEDRGRDGGTNFILRIKEQETRLTLQEHDNDDDDDIFFFVFSSWCYLVLAEGNKRRAANMKDGLLLRH